MSNINFEQNIEHNRLEIKKLPEIKVGQKKSKIGSSLAFAHTLQLTDIKINQPHLFE